MAGDNDEEGEDFCHCLWFYVLQILFGGGLLVCEQLLTKPTRSCKANVSLMMTMTLPAKFNKSRYIHCTHYTAGQ